MVLIHAGCPCWGKCPGFLPPDRLRGNAGKVVGVEQTTDTEGVCLGFGALLWLMARTLLAVEQDVIDIQMVRKAYAGPVVYRPISQEVLRPKEHHATGLAAS